MDIFESFDETLDRIKSEQKDWLVCLQTFRANIDDSYNAGELDELQWRYLVRRSAKIQDIINGG